MDVNLLLSTKVFENSLEGIYITDASGKIALVNSAFTRATGYTEADAVGQRPAFLSSGWHGPFFSQEIKPKLDEHGYWEGELINRRATGEVFPAWVAITQVRDDDGVLHGHITSFRDITDDKSSVARIRKLAYFDPLTDLPNRSLFHDRLAQAIQRAQRKQACFALLFLDLDGFKPINDTLGHAVGDQLLKAVAQRLESCIRTDDTAARLGGDEFSIILNSLPDHDAAESASIKVSSKIMQSLGEPFELEGTERYVSASIGIALYPWDADDADDLLNNADTAMYHAKNRGKNDYQFFTSEMNERMLERTHYQDQLHKAFADNDFELAFAPIYKFGDNHPIAVEALLRWRHPEKGLVDPEQFVLEAQDTGLLMKLGEWTIHQACQQMAQWLSLGADIERISVNISALQFTDGNFVHIIIDALDRSGLSPNQLELELKEATLMDDFGYSYSLLQDLNALGVRICIDDFGTGLSSLNYLRQLPITGLKIAASFIENVHLSETDKKIVEAIVILAHSLGYFVVAKGIQAPPQRDVVLSLGCEEGQGLVLGSPKSTTEMQALLRTFS